jgi:hypothetical protein
MFRLPKDIWMPILRFRVAKTQPDKTVATAVGAQLKQSLIILSPGASFVCPLWHRERAMPRRPAVGQINHGRNLSPPHGRLSCALWTTPSNSVVIAR